jgi:threonine/homoserine/homoserine lactone efflux protein
MDAWFFWKSLSIGLAVAAPVGPMSLLCIHRTLDHGQGAGLIFGAGVAAADLTYAAIAAFGVTAVSSVLLAGTFWINRFSGTVLVAFAVYGFATLA